MKVIIDRFEGNYAVCEKENQEMIDIEKEKLPAGAKAGDSLIIKEDGVILPDLGETKNRKKRIEKLMEDMWE